MRSCGEHTLLSAFLLIGEQIATFGWAHLVIPCQPREGLWRGMEREPVVDSEIAVRVNWRGEKAFTRRERAAWV